MSSNNEKQQQNEVNSEDGGSNKRQKLDSGSNNNESEIDITNLNKKLFVQLREIANTLGISTKNSTKKSDLIEMIKAVVKRKQDFLVKQEVNNNINSFKEIIKFTILDGIDPLEWLFWKVFRNKFIYRRIMSFMDKNLTPDYNSIISVYDMIKSNQLEILRDKVIINQYLVFSYELDGENNSFKQIFNTFKNDDDRDRLFYQQLFKYYRNYILEFNIIRDVKKHLVSENSENERELLVNQLIESKCLPAYQILIQQYQYQPTIINLQYAINLGTIKFIKLLLQQQQQQQQQPKISTTSIRNILLSNKQPTISSFKSLNWLQNENIICITEYTFHYTKSVYEQINETITLKLLISICKSILLSTSTTPNSINMIKEIESFSNGLSKQELSLPISDWSFQIQQKKEFILKLLNVYYSFTSESIPEFYYLYFKCIGTDYNGQKNESGGSSDNGFNSRGGGVTLLKQYKQSLQFANFELLKHCALINKSVYYIKYLSELAKSTATSPSLLFSHCDVLTNKEEKRLAFIDSLIGDIKDSKINFKAKSLILPYHILLFLVDYDNVELVKYFLTELGNLDQFSFNEYKVNQFIKSTQMLDFLYLNYQDFFQDSGIWLFKNIQLLQHYESLVLNNINSGKGKRINGSELHSVERFLLNPLNEFMQHIIDTGSSIYKFNNVESIYSLINSFCINEYSKFDMMKSMFIKFQLVSKNKDDLLKPYTLYDQIIIDLFSLSIAKFLEWLYIYHPDYLNSRFAHDPQFYIDGITLDVFYRIGRFDKLENSPIMLLLAYHIEIKDIKSMDFFCNKLKLELLPEIKESNESKSVILMFSNILKQLCYKGRLDIFQHIQHNHSWIFIPLTKNNTSSSSSSLSIFTVKELKRFLFDSIDYSLLSLAEFFFEFITITKTEFNANASDISKFYFRNKFK